MELTPVKTSEWNKIRSTMFFSQHFYRGKKLMPSPVKVLAEEHGLPVFQPASLRSPENQQLVAGLNADVMVVVAYGLILPKAVLDMPRLS